MPTAAETDRQIRRLYNIAYRIDPIGRMLTNPHADTATVTYAMARIPKALSAANRLLALPGVAEHPETPYARSFLNTAQRQLNAPTTRLLLIANHARQAAAHADATDDDLQVIVFRNIEHRCRNLTATARVEPALGRRGWTRNDHVASDRLQHWAAQWGLTTDPTPPPAATPQAPAEMVRQAAARAAIRNRCAAGIRCTEPDCQTYGALKVTTLPGAWLCPACIPKANARLAAHGCAPDTIRPDPGAIPDGARYIVSMHNVIGPGTRSIDCDTPQRAQFIAETERPFNNTFYNIWIALPRR
ncbi:hypothetical protein [Streptomyces botrytidirepellens]|uniref:Uncharacterized protein n=1 Tax=Streptomyces botrytidirepellens TaxID=2486417 RepID=A0A3M8V7D8_9ACTN|nr:hypothetical protein [Streptomyces botrytidirepellens]RNG12959.1 hypothetical protein EEJ42_31975 [Streptomyces botrytidirepellens]